jgi:malto-oligosyltrehalose trehalohydrolase
MKRRRVLPFGAEIVKPGTVRFRLWAPAAKRVDLLLEGEEGIPMEAGEGGWFSLVRDRAPAGTRYRYLLEGAMKVPDPASRFQPFDVHGPSEVVDPAAWEWEDSEWRGLPWEEAVLYELHVGTFTSEGTFAGASRRLDYLADLGVTAIELMPISDFPGRRNWGYDGVFPFAPENRYGSPAHLKSLIQEAHARGLMVFLDVVYNHFGPEGNYLRHYAPQFFTARHKTPWGDALNFDGPGSRTVRDFFIENALYWIEEYHFDGLRLDAVHAIVDDTEPDILEELAEAVHQGPGRERRVHLVLENDHNASRYLQRDAGGRPRFYTAQWNDDIHHAMHVLITGETQGYYMDYADDPLGHLTRSLTEGFAYQGEPSPYRNGTPRGESTRDLPAAAFVSFLQNHDQVGNRAFGERIGALAREETIRAATAIFLLSPSPPLLFMGQELGSRQPFLFFCDFGPELANAVREGRRNEFARFPEFQDMEVRVQIPDPNAAETFSRVVLNWNDLHLPPQDRWLAFHRTLLRLRRKEIAHRLGGVPVRKSHRTRLSPSSFQIGWILGDGSHLNLAANLGPDPVPLNALPPGRLLYAQGNDFDPASSGKELPTCSVIWTLEPPPGRME